MPVTPEEIRIKMKELESLIGYHFDDIRNLELAMNVERHPNQYGETNYMNSALAELVMQY